MKYDIGDTVPKTIDTRRNCKVYRVMSMQSHPYISVFRGCGKLSQALNSIYLAVPTVFGTVSSLYPTLILHLYNEDCIILYTLGANIWACARAQSFENAHASMCEYTEGCGAKTETRTAVYNVD